MTELHSRELEIATAKAMGRTLWYHENEGHVWVDEHNIRRSDFGVQLGECAPAYLTDPTAFASVLAALDEAKAEVCIWFYHGRRLASVGPKAFCFDGATYQEAVCRAFVAWKGAQ